MASISLSLFSALIAACSVCCVLAFIASKVIGNAGNCHYPLTLLIPPALSQLILPLLSDRNQFYFFICSKLLSAAFFIGSTPSFVPEAAVKLNSLKLAKFARWAYNLSFVRNQP
ncbi:MAG: hypothetical protein IPJ79_13320 [Bacteroidetes bacterium]|nr:hypothetical protein [Bacteroidota bacterium]